MRKDSRVRFAFVVIAIIATHSVGCYAQSPQTQFSVPDLVYSVDISKDGKLVAAGSRGDSNETLSVFDVTRSAKVWNAGAGTYIWDVAFSPDQKWLVSGSDSGLQIWDVRGGRAPMVLPPPRNTLPEVKHLSVSPQGNFLAISRGYKIELWDFVRRKMLRFVPSTGGGALAFSPDEKWLAVAGYHNRLKIHDVESGSLLGEIHAEMGILMSADFSSDGRTLAVASEGATKIFSIDTNGDSMVIAELARVRGGLGCDISENGKWLASGGYSGNVSINKVPSGKLMRSIEVEQGKNSIYEAKFSTDNTQLVVGGMLQSASPRRGVVQIWNVADVLDLPDEVGQK